MTKEDIKRIVMNSDTGEYSHVIIWCDTYDFEYSYIYVKYGEDIKTIVLPNTVLYPLLSRQGNYSERANKILKELEYIKSILGNDNGRPDLFYLSSPRWKENKYKFRTPGPAYYFNSLP